MNSYFRLITFLLFVSPSLVAQHLNKMVVDVDYESKVFKIKQEITFWNQTGDTVQDLVLNDWSDAYSSKSTPLAKRFSDEYVRAFHLAKDEERGHTKIFSIIDQNGLVLNWKHPEKHPDIIDVQLKNPIYPNQKFKFFLTYEVKIPSDRFTHYGYNDNGSFNLKDWYLTPARMVDNRFVMYSNDNLNDIANSACDFDITLKVPHGITVATDLYQGNKNAEGPKDEYYLTGKNFTDFSLVLQKENTFEKYNFPKYGVNLSTNLQDTKVADIEKTILIDNIVGFVSDNLGSYPKGKLLVTQADYDHNPVYGLNQLPSFLSPFPDSFIYEIQFLKTYIDSYLHNTLRLDPRKDAWIYDGIQTYLMIKYMEQYHPDEKMMGLLSEWGILKGHYLFQTGFNSQYNYLYLLMARKNLDQPIGDPKNTFIKFNEQIAGKYKAGLGLNYLDSYLDNDVVPNSIKQFYELNRTRQATREDFEQILKNNSPENIDWFFTTLVDSREIIDYKFGHVKKEGDSLQVTVKNKTGANAPVSLYGLKDGHVLFKKWLSGITADSTFTIAKQGAERLALNYNNEMPEYNLRDNWKSLKGIFPNNKPFKFTFFQDLENPHYNQVFYVPSFIYNLYDGFSPGLRLHNKSLLEKPFVFDIAPTYSLNTGNLIGSASLVYNRNIRDQNLYSIRYILAASTYHYAPDASYTKFTPAIQFYLREPDFRKNKKEYILLRQVIVNRQQSAYVATDSQNKDYSVFNARYGKYESEITQHYDFNTDVQIANSFGKLSGEVQYRRLFRNNRQINLRFFAGLFMYRDTNSEYFSFGIDRPTDYLFDYNFYGRSESSGLFSQQYIMAEGGFKSMFDTRYANQWITTLNGSFNIWHWIELYGDAGLFKNKYNSARFIYDSGVRFNILPDYFELYFPVYSSNGFEMSDNYADKVRFVVTLTPKTLINLFTRKWF